MNTTETNRIFYPIKQEEGQEAYCLAGSASCLPGRFFRRARIPLKTRTR